MLDGLVMTGVGCFVLWLFCTQTACNHYEPYRCLHRLHILRGTGGLVMRQVGGKSLRSRVAADRGGWQCRGYAPQMQLVPGCHLFRRGGLRDESRLVYQPGPLHDQRQRLESQRRVTFYLFYLVSLATRAFNHISSRCSILLLSFISSSFTYWSSRCQLPDCEPRTKHIAFAGGSTSCR